MFINIIYMFDTIFLMFSKNRDSLKKFQHHQKLKQAALTAIAVHLSPKDIAHLKEVFKNLDHNGDGCLNLDELRAGIADMRSGEDLM